MALNTIGQGASPTQTLSFNMKLISHHELEGFGGVGEGVGLQKALWNTEG